MGLEHSNYFIFSAQQGATILQQQHPVLFEDTVPDAGNPLARWEWSDPVVISGNFGSGTTFTPHDSIWVDNNDDGLDDNAQGQYCQLECVVDDWETSGGASIQGVLRFRLTDSTNGSNQVTRDVTINLRVINHTSFNLFENQTGSSELVPDDGLVFNFETLSNSISTELNINFTYLGSMTVTYDSAAYTWPTTTQVGTMQLSIQQTGGPASVIDNIALTIKPMIDLSIFNLFENQTGSDALVPDEGFGYTFTAATHSFGTGLTINMSALGSISATTTSAFTWPGATTAGTFDFSIEETGKTTSEFDGVNMTLKPMTDLSIFNLFENQTGSDELVPDEGFSYTFTAATHSFGTGLTINMSALGSISATTTSAFTWPGATTAGTFDFSIEETGKTTSEFDGMPMSLRQLSSATVRVSNPGATSSIAVNDSTGETWNWLSITDDLNLNNLDINSNGTITATPQSPATEITGGDYGTGSVTVQLTDGGSPATALAPSCTVPLDASMDIDIQPVGGSTLPHGRQKMLYQASLDVDCEIEAGHTITVAFNGAAGNITNNLELVAHGTIDNRWILQSKVDTGTGDLIYLPDTLVGTTSIPITVVKKNAGNNVVAQSADLSFDLIVDPTKDYINAAILLDRSGSMSAKPNGSVASRWDAAANGAGVFAHLLQNADDVANHKLGVYWFSSGSPAAHTMGSYTVAGNSAAGPGEDVEATCKGQSPSGATALGRGLLLCKTELEGTDTGAEDLVILAISDGMENQTPLTPEIFTNTTSPDYWKSGGDPNIRIYPLAIMTNTTATTRLKNLVEYTNGTPDVDFTHIETWDATAPTNPITKWFIKMFVDLYGYNLVAAGVDPELNKNADAWQTVQVHSGQSQIIFYANHNDPNPSYWDLTIHPPNSGTPIGKYEAQNTPGIRYAENRYCTMITVNNPIQLPGAEHCWVGDWKMQLTRKESPKGYYDMGALAKEQMKFRVDLAAQGVAQPKKRVLVHATLRDKKGKPITDARMIGTLTEPTSWIGDHLTKELKRNPYLLTIAKKDKSIAALDITDPADKALNTLLKKIKFKPGCTKRFSMKHKGNGVYVGAFIPSGGPGEYAVDVSCVGYRTAPKVEIFDHKKRLLDLVKTTAPIAAKKHAESLSAPVTTTTRRTTRTTRISSTARTRTTRSTTSLRVVTGPTLSAAAIKKYEATYKKNALDSLIAALCKRQKYTLEYRGTWNVPFVTDARHTEAFGYMEDANTICLNVTPKDDSGHLLGPGQSGQVKFISPLGRKHKWPSKDLLDGSYEVMIPFKAGKMILERKTTCLVSSRFSLVHPDFRRPIKPKFPTLGLKEFGVEVCGVFIPITVFAAAGDTTTKEVHLLGCKDFTGLKDENLIWFEDIRDIIKHRYTPCPKCIPTPVRPPRRPRKPVKPTKPIRRTPIRRPR